MSSVSGYLHKVKVQRGVALWRQTTGEPEVASGKGDYLVVVGLIKMGLSQVFTGN